MTISKILCENSGLVMVQPLALQMPNCAQVSMLIRLHLFSLDITNRILILFFLRMPFLHRCRRRFFQHHEMEPGNYDLKGFLVPTLNSCFSNKLFLQCWIHYFIAVNINDLDHTYATSPWATNNPCSPQGEFSRVWFSESLWKMLQNKPCLHSGRLGVKIFGVKREKLCKITLKIGNNF